MSKENTNETVNETKVNNSVNKEDKIMTDEEKKAKLKEALKTIKADKKAKAKAKKAKAKEDKHTIKLVKAAFDQSIEAYEKEQAKEAEKAAKEGSVLGTVATTAVIVGATAVVCHLGIKAVKAMGAPVPNVTFNNNGD